MLISGCSKKPYLLETLEEYTQRLSNVLEAEHQISFVHEVMRVTETKSESTTLATAQVSARIKLREFYNLPDCGVKPLIAERNTTMGKLQAPSQRYLYELRLVKALSHCLTIMTDAEDQQKLQAILTTKQKDMDSSWRVFVNKSQEIARALTSNTSHLELSENHDFALLSWQQILNFSPDVAMNSRTDITGELEAHLKTIAEYKTPAKLVNDMRLVSTWLPKVTRFLETQTSGFTCVPRKEKQKVEYLKNVFHLFFIQEIQPLTSNMNKWYYKLEPVLESLDHPKVQPQGQHGFKQLKQDYDQNLKQHVMFWQTLFKRCNVSPAA